jgi:hypothetical protein
LTLVNGLVRAINHLGLGHVRTANMTGTVVCVGFAAVGVPVFSFLASGISASGVWLATFPGGSAGEGYLDPARLGRSHRPWVGPVLTTEALLLSTATAVAFATPGHARYAAIALRALVMGVRRSEVRKGEVRRPAVMELPATVLPPALPSG